MSDDESIGKQEVVFLKEPGLYKLLMISRKPVAKTFQKWVFNVIKEIRLKGKYDLEEQLKLKDLELVMYKEKIYEEIEKTGHVYVIKMDGGYKIGKTKDAVIKRVKGMQTANVNNIVIMLDYECSNADLLEKCVHYILERYRCNNNREFFDCDVDYIIEIVTIMGCIIDTLKSMYQHISINDIKKKIENKLIVSLNADNLIENNRIENDECIKDNINKNIVLRTCSFCNVTYARKETLLRHLRENTCSIGKKMDLIDFHNKILYRD